MILKIGIIYQDLNSLGFLRGLKDRLKCDAELIPPPTAMGKPRQLPRRSANAAWQYFQKKGVDLVVRFTDADGQPWQEVKRKELDVVPHEGQSIWICAIAVNNPEEWLCLDEGYLAEVLGVPKEELRDPVQRADRVKSAIKAAEPAVEDRSEIVARIVRRAPQKVFRRWLEDNALRTFYTDCRNAAKRADCETPDELEAPSHA